MKAGRKTFFITEKQKRRWKREEKLALKAKRTEEIRINTERNKLKQQIKNQQP